MKSIGLISETFQPRREHLAWLAILIFSSITANAQPSAFQGFENLTDVNCWAGDGTITRVPSGGGTLHVPSFDGFFHAEITNMDNAFQNPGFGDSKFTEFCLPPSGYQGDFSQSISVYIFANWPPAAGGGSPSFWIDESPRDTAGQIADGANALTQSAEHNFRLTATGTHVDVASDGNPTFATITTTGWYTFQMTWRKDPNPGNPVLSDLRIFDAHGNLVGTTTVSALPIPNPLLSSNLGGPGYLWFTVWQNGFAGDVLAIDDARVGSAAPLVAAAVAGAQDGPFQVAYAANLDKGDSVVNVSNDGFNGGFFGAGTAGNLCVNTYVFDPQEEEIGCCSCLVSPNGLNSLSVKSDLISNNLTPAVPTSVAIKLLASLPGSVPGSTSLTVCNPSTVGTPAFPLEEGMLAWGTSLEPNSTTGSFNAVHVPFLNGGLSASELAGVTSLCNFIQANGSNFGICRSCRLGALGASKN